MAQIELREVSKRYKVVKREKGAAASLRGLFHRQMQTVRALERVSFSIDEGEIVGYIGPNGAGKSTTIKIMSGILVPESGECSILGVTPWQARKRYVRRIGVVFGQRTQLWWDVPIADSFDLLRDIYCIPEARYLRTLDTLCQTLGLEGFLHTPLRQLSLGQRMRAELAASLLHEPEILFLDEPTIGLDAVSKLAVRKFIREMNAERKLTVILTTHDMQDIDALTDRVILIGKGRILHDGSLQAIKQRFDGSRKLCVTFAPHTQPVIPEHCSLLSWATERAEFAVDTNETSVSQAVNTLSEKLHLLDMTSASPPAEEIIAQLYQTHDIL